MVARRLVALLLVGWLATIAGAARAESIVLASTTSVQDSGLLERILPAFTAATGIDVRVLAQGTGQALATAARGDADLVLANIQADVLIALAPALPSRLAPGATVILSGLLQQDVPAVLDAYRAVGLSLEARRDQDEWAGLRLRAP